MIQKNYKEDIKVFDQIESEALEMGDMISQAIVKQFPQMFKYEKSLELLPSSFRIYTIIEKSK